MCILFSCFSVIYYSSRASSDDMSNDKDVIQIFMIFHTPRGLHWNRQSKQRREADEIKEHNRLKRETFKRLGLD